jgi:hypothetical protein
LRRCSSGMASRSRCGGRPGGGGGCQRACGWKREWRPSAQARVPLGVAGLRRCRRHRCHARAAFRAPRGRANASCAARTATGARSAPKTLSASGVLGAGWALGGEGRQPQGQQGRGRRCCRCRWMDAGSLLSPCLTRRAPAPKTARSRGCRPSRGRWPPRSGARRRRLRAPTSSRCCARRWQRSSDPTRRPTYAVSSAQLCEQAPGRAQPQHAGSAPRQDAAAIVCARARGRPPRRRPTSRAASPFALRPFLCPRRLRRARVPAVARLRVGLRLPQPADAGVPPAGAAAGPGCGAVWRLRVAARHP